MKMARTKFAKLYYHPVSIKNMHNYTYVYVYIYIYLYSSAHAGTGIHNIYINIHTLTF